MQTLDMQSLPGNIVIVAPHMDDEALACGGLIAKLPNKNRIHIIYATDGMKSPAPIIPGRDEITPDLGKVRMRESKQAMALLGVPEQNLHFLSLPEAHLQKNASVLGETLKEKLIYISPKHILVPFRYDRHPDHLSVNHVVGSVLEAGVIQAQLVEYFVYYRWRLLPKGDIRKYIKSQYLFKLDIADVAKQKRKSLDCFKSQITIYYPWQTRPILTSKLLDEECQNPEYYLIADTSHSGAAVFSYSVPWIRLAHRLEPILVRIKYLMGAYMKRILKS